MWHWRPPAPIWSDPSPALAHAGSLNDTAAGRAKYLEYLVWLAEDEPARRRMQFARMSRDWVIGTAGFAKAMLQEHRALARRPAKPGSSLLAASEILWNETLDELLAKVGHRRSALPESPPLAEWKLAVAAALKDRTTVTNRWLGLHLAMGSRSHVSRKVTAWRKNPDPKLARIVGLSALRIA